MLWFDTIKRDSEVFASFIEYLRGLRAEETTRMDFASSFEDVLRAQGAKATVNRIEQDVTAEEREARDYRDFKHANS